MNARLFPIVFFAASTLFAQGQIDSIEINQGIGVQKNNALKFVAGRNTVVRAFLASPVTVENDKTSATITRDGASVATLAPRTYDGPTGVVDFLCPTLDACGNWAAGSYTFDVRVNDVAKSTTGTKYDFVERGMIRILAVPVIANYGGKVVPVTDSRWKTFAEYVRRTYPVAEDKLIYVTREDFDASGLDLETDDGRLGLWEALAKLIPAKCTGTPTAEGCYNQVFGFITARPMGYPNGRLQGYTYGRPANVGVLTDEDAAATVAHEIGHTFGLGDTYDGGSFACAVNPAPTGFTGRDFDDPSKTVSCNGREALPGVSATKIPAAQHPYDVGGRGPLPDVAEYMGSGGAQNQFWTTQDAYDLIFDKNTPETKSANGVRSTNAVPQRYVQCFGSISQNATSQADARIEPCWSYEDTDPLVTTTGPYMIAAVDAAGRQLAANAFHPQFDPVAPKGLPPQHIDFAPFETEVGFPAGTAKLLILHNGVTVKEIAVSANAPVITDVAPQAAGTVSGPITVSWNASDADGDRLTYEVIYNADVTNPNSDWQVVARDLIDRFFRIDFSAMPGGPHAQLGVIATDGINASEAESNEFTVPAKAPEVIIGELENGGVFFAGHEVVLAGDAFDLQDDDMPESSLRWTSNISGFLGNGSAVKVANLPLGVHTITLTATNSYGVTGSARTTVRIVSGTKRRSVRR